MKRSVFSDIRLWAFIILIVLGVAPLVLKIPYMTFGFSALTFLEVILLFNILIIVHELGHFLAAKWCGLKIEKFAVWFGKPLWSKTVDGVEYILGTIPFGGYVALPQMAPMEALEGKNETPREELPPASPWQKIIVAFAGPLFSFGLALVFATIVWVVGKPSTAVEKTTTIGFVVPKGPADQAGLRAGDVLQSIDGHRVTRWLGVGDGVTWCIMTIDKPTVPIVVTRDGEEKTFQVTPAVDTTVEHHWYQRNTPPKVQIAPEDSVLIVDKMLPNSPALLSGLQKGDRLVQLDGAKIYCYAQVYQHMKDAPDAPLKFTVQRGDSTLPITVQPVRPISPKPKDIPKDEPPTAIGVDFDDSKDVVLDHPTPWHQVAESADMVRSTLVALFTPHSNVSATQLNGPIGIMNVLFRVLSSENGWRLALWITVIINVNLAILNMFPFPVLDGGHILLSIIEWIRRRPLSMALLEPLQTACALMLIGYMLFITFYDVQDSGHMAFGGDELKFAPKQSP